MDNKDLNQIDKTIEEIRENLEHKDIKLESNKIYKQEEILLKKMLNEEIEEINNKIKSSNPKWIIENFDEFLCEKFERNRNEKIIEVKILKRKDAFKLGDILKRLRGSNKDNTKSIKIIWADGFNYWCYKDYFNEERVIELLKGWIFYCNTKVEYKKIKFGQNGYDKSSLVLARIGLNLLYIALIAMVLLGGIIVVIIIMGFMSMI